MSAYPELLDGMMNAILARDASGARDFIEAKKGFSPEEQLSVYADGYRFRLMEVMENTYPALLYAMGKAAFAGQARAYIEANPSRYFNIDKYPLPFAAFLAGNESNVFFQELAMLESVIHDVYQMAETSAIERNWIEAQTPETLAGSVFLLREAARLMGFSYLVSDYLSAFRAGENPAPPAPAQNFLLVVRHRHQVQRLALDEAEFALLSLLATGKTLDAALEDAQFAPYITAPELSGDLMRWFARWVQEGCLRQPV